MNADDALTLAHAAGVRVHTDGDDLLLEASAPPPTAVLDLLSRHKADIVTMLRSPAPEQLPRVAEPPPPTAVSGEPEHAGPGGTGGCPASCTGRWSARCCARPAA